MTQLGTTQILRATTATLPPTSNCSFHGFPRSRFQFVEICISVVQIMVSTAGANRFIQRIRQFGGRHTRAGRAELMGLPPVASTHTCASRESNEFVTDRIIREIEES